ncbi:response regulator transcription factor [Endozoicomonas arenosclerae]|uniref:response regulator transcription factor n=1 Tax=Endozoicomonas arenosclerae TaxID=1633495 RepID=UPI000785DD2A|nr:response regulator transcription factor [Endozoicomonas arenosclerae]
MKSVVYLVTENSFQITLLENSLQKHFEFRTLSPGTIASNRVYSFGSLFLMDMSILSQERLQNVISNLANNHSNHRIALFNTDKNQCIQFLFEQYDIRGLFYKDDSLSQLIKGIQLIMDDEYWIPRKTMASVIKKMRRRPHIEEPIQKVIPDDLTPREREILVLVSTGATNTEIARKIFLSENTVKTHLSNLYKKLDIKNRTQASAWVKNLSQAL